MQNCPICRAALGEASTCRRCRTDLSRVQEIELLGRSFTGAAMVSLAEGDLHAARRWVQRAGVVHAAPAVRMLEQILARASAGPSCTASDDSFVDDSAW